MYEDIYILGAGGFGREVADTVCELRHFNLVGFIDDSLSIGSLVNGHAVCGATNFLEEMSCKPNVILAIGNPRLRHKIYQRLHNRCIFPNIVHPKALISSHAKLSDAVIIQANCVVAANATIGTGVVINANSGVGHDTVVNDFCSIMSFCDIAGNSYLGEYCFMGTGTKVIPKTTVYSGSYACAGSIIVKNVSQASKLMGNPARVIGVPD